MCLLHAAISKTCTSPGESGRPTTEVFFQKDMISSFDAYKPERNLQKQHENLIISRLKERLVCLFLTDNFTHTSACVDTEKEIKLVFLTRQLELSSQKQFSMNDCFALQSYPKCNYEQHRDFLVLPCKRKLQYMTLSIDKDQVLRETLTKSRHCSRRMCFSWSMKYRFA
ncbi:hypothetical protein FHG87_003089 [Trinorchestia longiramus]|nr:hypothetical protein FHG87_003089 [Trinorchestia longiramus]